MLAMRWAMRLIGLVSTVILARLLSPRDFGIIAMAMLVVGLLQLISWTGVDLALIKDSKATREHYDTAWTIQVIQGIILAALLLAVAPFSEVYFEEASVVAVIQALALKAALQGFSNIGVVEFRKALNFETEFRFGMYKKVSAFIVTVAAAILLRNYWAIVVALILAEVIAVAISFVMHPFRPRFSLMKWREIWSFSQWLLISRIGLYLNRKVDQLIVGRTLGTTSMGFYHVAQEVGTLFSDEFVMPVRRALFPNLVQVKEDRAAFSRAIYTTVGTLSVLSFAAGFGLAAISENFTHFVLGDQWDSASILVQWLAMFGSFAGVALSLEVLLIATDNTRLSALVAWTEFVVAIPILYVVAIDGGLEGMAISRMSLAAFFMVVMMTITCKVCSLSLFRIAASVVRPLLAAGIMFFLIELAQQDVAEYSFIGMLRDIGLGVLIFPTLTAAFWWISGRPDGFERAAISTLQRFRAVALGRFTR